MRITTSYNNFSRGQIDHDMNGRFDLPIYQSGLDMCLNFETNFKGNAIYRTGFESMFEFQDCEFIEFKFKNDQQYLCTFYNTKIRFLSYASDGTFGWVESSPSVILEVTTPYDLAESKLLQYTQKDDVMYVTLQGTEPYKLTRVSAASFTFTPFARKSDPFPLTWDTAKTITAVTQATEAQITAATHGYSVDERVKISSIAGMTELNDWTVRVTEIVDASNFKIDVDTTDFTAYSSGGTAEEVLTGDYPKCCLFYKSRLYYGATPLKITTMFGSESALYDEFALSPVDETSALIFTPEEISQELEWLFAGSNSLIAGSSDGILAVNGGGVGVGITAGNVAAQLTDAPPCNSTYPHSKDGYIFYVGLDGRNMYYFNYDLLSESFQAEDANFVSYDITTGGMGKIRHKKDRNDLMFAVGGDGNLLSVNVKLKENIIGWHEHLSNSDSFIDQAVITDNDGKPQLFVLTLRGGTYFIERQGKYVEFRKRTKFFTAAGLEDLQEISDAKAADDEAYNRFVAEQLKECIYLDNALIASNLQDNSITYTGDVAVGSSGTIVDTDGVFVSGDVDKHIVYKTLTGYESGRFVITGYTDANTVDVNVLQEPTATTYTDWYLSFKTLSGLTQYNGTTVSIVTDGGYLDDFAVSGGAVDLGNYNSTHAVVGYKYFGAIKSFTLGFQIQAENTQTTMTAISEFVLRFVSSAGGGCGSSLYKLEAVQELTPNILNYLPPIPMDGTKPISYSDDNEQDKEFYIVQNEPLPMTLTGVMLKANYVART